MPNEEESTEDLANLKEVLPKKIGVFQNGFNPQDFPHSDKPFNFDLNKMNEDDNSVYCFDSGVILEVKKPTRRKKAVAPPAKPQFPKVASCCSCKKDILEDGKTQYFRAGIRNSHGERSYFYCQGCSDKFAKCSCCNHNFLISSLQLNHCEHCVAEAPNRYIEAYNTKVESKIEKKGEPRDNIYFGVELELVSERLGLDTLIVRNFTKDFAKLKKDRSIVLNGVEFCGFEIVTCPCSAEVHATIWDDFFANLPQTSYPNETCGMHVHASRVRLTDLQIAKILMILHNGKNRAYIEAIAERKSGHHNNFHDVRPICEAKEGGFYKVKDRHTALNLNNRNTIEFRLFASTRDKATLLKNIEFCRAIMKFTGMGEFSVNDIKEFATFFSYVKKYHKEYPNLWNFLRQNPAFDKLK